MSVARIQTLLDKKTDEKQVTTSMKGRLVTWGYKQAVNLYNRVPWAPLWLPINSANYTGYAFPQTSRLQGTILQGRASKLAAHDILKGLMDNVMEAAKLAEKDPLGRCYFSSGFFVAPTWVFLVTKAADWDQILLHNPTKLTRGTKPFVEFFYGKDNIMGLTPGPEWRVARNEILKHLFNDDVLENLATKMQAIIESHVKDLPAESKLSSLESIFGKLTIDIMSTVNIGTKAIEKNALFFISAFISDAYDEMLHPITQLEILLRAAVEKYLRTNLKLAVLKYIDSRSRVLNVKKSLHNLIKENLINPNVDEICKADTLLRDFAIRKKLEKKAEESKVQESKAQKSTAPVSEKIDFTSDAILSEVIFLFLMAQEDLTPFLTFTIMLLAKHSDATEKVFAEMDAVNDDFSLKNLEKMEFLLCVLLESLRLYAPAPIAFRQVLSDGLTLGNIGPTKTAEEYQVAMANRDRSFDVHLRPGTVVFISPLITHRSQSNYEKPDEFFPERWLEKVRSKKMSIYNIQTDGFHPFFHGIQRCPAQRYALIQTALTMCEILKKFTVNLDPSMTYPPQIYSKGSLRSSTPIRLQFISRQELKVRPKEEKGKAIKTDITCRP